MKKPRESDDKASAEPRGPAAWETWKTWLQDREDRKDPTFRGAYEVPLYTDVYVTGELEEGYGPYRLLNLVPHIKPGVSRQAIVLRVEAQIVFDSEDPLFRLDDLPRGTKCKRYHGGGRDDEVAALFSLSLGIRLKPGDWLRRFIPGEDPKGKPLSPYGAEPILLRRADRPVIPRATREQSPQSLNDDVLVKHFWRLEGDDAFAVVRASRLYQDALWIAESQPELSWLMLVSALEIAARHRNADEGSAVEMLRVWYPELEELLREKGDDAWVYTIAKRLVPLMRSKKQFVDFARDFMPGPPPDRPKERAQCPWDKTAMEKAMETIYDHRSKALHDGTPFPLPMCQPPRMTHGNGEVAAERPENHIAFPTLGVKWGEDDLPMHLHTFEYIVQGALCKWWKDMVERRTDTAEGGCAT